jgi:hypothetical protein
LDCLDRTNAFQNKVGIIVVDQMLRYCRIDIFGIDQSIENVFDQYEKSSNQNVNQLREIWANNGDNISKIYAGTGATTSSVTRRGKD